MRNAEKDLAMCNAATPEPWIIGGFSNVMYQKGNIDIRIPKTQGDRQFIAMSREALPYWINRAQEAEAENAKLREALEKIVDKEKMFSWDAIGAIAMCITIIEIARQAIEEAGE